MFGIDDRYHEDFGPEDWTVDEGQEGTWEDRETDANGQCFSDADGGL